MSPKKEDLGQLLDLNKFQSVGGVSMKKLNLGLWVVSHRRGFVIGLIVFLIVLSVIFYGYTIYNYVDYFFFGGKLESQNLEQLATMPVMEESQKLASLAKKIIDYPPSQFLNNKKYDFLVQVSNPNDNFFASFDYCFLDGNTEIACANTFILPSETRYILSLANSLAGRPVNLNFKIKKVTWQRLNLHQYPNWPDFYSTHLDFSSANVEFKPANASGVSEKIEINDLTFKITNNSAFNYWEVPLNIVLFVGQTPIGINRYTVDNFSSGESRDIEISWADSISSIDEAKIIPEINVLDDTVFMKYK